MKKLTVRRDTLRNLGNFSDIGEMRTSSCHTKVESSSTTTTQK